MSRPSLMRGRDGLSFLPWQCLRDPIVEMRGRPFCSRSSCPSGKMRGSHGYGRTVLHPSQLLWMTSDKLECCSAARECPGRRCLTKASHGRPFAMLRWLRGSFWHPKRPSWRMFLNSVKRRTRSAAHSQSAHCAGRAGMLVCSWDVLTLLRFFRCHADFTPTSCGSRATT